MGKPITVRAPGKVNLYLAVGPTRADGFHDLATVFQAVSLYDDITATPNDGGITLSMSGLGEHLPVDDTNLAVRAAAALAREAGVDLTETGVDLHIHKRIPVAGGMAGGSADAAGTLIACDALWGTKLPNDRLLALAADLGSDVPFCLLGGTAVGYGRGENLTPLLARGTYTYLVATMLEGLSTPAVFKEFDSGQSGPVPPPEVAPTFLRALAQGDTQLVAYFGRNDLMSPALELHRGARHVMEFFCQHSLTVMISGSGPTLIAQVESVERGEGLAERLRNWPHVADAFVVTGPVTGVEFVPDRYAPSRTRDRALDSHPNRTRDQRPDDEFGDDAFAGDSELDASPFDTSPFDTSASGNSASSSSSSDVDDAILRHPSHRSRTVRPLLRVIRNDDEIPPDDAAPTPDADATALDAPPDGAGTSPHAATPSDDVPPRTPNDPRTDT
ncbi:4-(cytidine 5'-diphospho)-2-C-methyl-D-erythritol kinase [Bowdeniella nasicola]|uniref:4-diphosphocytidyl-2-C-methyl-D-erythritol kinase n=1 Tax=Bowdeniella nasicola TaxID=208480 RepID=A0A1Q5Q2S5_9ACTO|nr:4-(cytidine 5'-diphospho)-2-C-methyl-D-erythritol kinase [Bowdeniella nasicola]OKL54106.1 4-(cytidine 5'-diphospho)-2-C-methyl-D-erythritol kinase [Bowdeniella nasicola]